MNTDRFATLYGVIAVTAFAATLPLTRVALEGFPPMALTFGRVLGAAVLALFCLIAVGARYPERRHLLPLITVALTGTFGFPLLVALSMENHPAGPGSVPLALIPLFAAAWSRLRGHERPGIGFWLWAMAGSGVVLHFALRNGGAVAPELFAAALMAAVAYAEGGRLAREMEGWRVMAWALALGSPFTAVGLGYSWAGLPSPGEPAPWIALALLAAVAQFGGFWFWYRALAAGVARGAQIQLLQPFLTLLLAALLLGEPLSAEPWLYAAAVVATIHLARNPPALPKPIKEC